MWEIEVLCRNKFRGLWPFPSNQLIIKQFVNTMEHAGELLNKTWSLMMIEKRFWREKAMKSRVFVFVFFQHEINLSCE